MNVDYAEFANMRHALEAVFFEYDRVVEVTGSHVAGVEAVRECWPDIDRGALVRLLNDRELNG